MFCCCGGSKRTQHHGGERTALLHLSTGVEPECNPYKPHKVVLVGEARAGKTQLTRRLARPESYTVQQHYRPTIGVDFDLRVIPETLLPPRPQRSDCGDQENAVVQFWDIAGSSKGSHFMRSWFRGASTCVLVADPTSATPVGEQITATITSVMPQLEDAATVFIITSKADLQPSRLTLPGVRSLVPNEYRDRIVGCSSTSAADSTGCEELFVELCQHLIDQRLHRSRQPTRPGAIRLPSLNDLVRRKKGCQ